VTAEETLTRHAAELAQTTGLQVEVIAEDNRLFVVVHDYSLPEGVSKVASTDVLFIADTQYPFSAMDMFWTNVGVVRPDDSTFENSESIEQYQECQWRRFSYHRNSTWNIAGNPLLDHFVFMETRWTGKALR